MSAPLLSTKFRIPPLRTNCVSRLDLLERMNGSARKLILLSAPAGFGKSTLIAQFASKLIHDSAPDGLEYRVAWLSLEESENDYLRFLSYLIGALQSMQTTREELTGIGMVTTAPLRLPRPMPEQVLVPLINQIADLSGRIVLVLDDYHHIDSETTHGTVAFLIENMPHNLRVVIATRHDPPLPLARLRADDEMTELRASDLRFTLSETTQFMNRTMDLELSPDEIAVLEARTEGWPAGLQLAGISLQGRPNAEEIIESFAGSHRHIADYLLEEVLSRQAEPIRRFLLETSILDRLCGSLCDTVTGRSGGAETLRLLERMNLFIIPLDEERQWYRYHELFADLLRQQLRMSVDSARPRDSSDIEKLHDRACRWYESNGGEIEAFRHAAAANDMDRAERLLSGGGMPLHFRGAAPAVLAWLKSLPNSVLDERPSLWVTYASASVFVGQNSGVEEKLRAAEQALRLLPGDGASGDTLGRIAAIRAMLAVPRSEVETILSESHRALEYLRPDNVPVRTASNWTLGVAYQLQGNRRAAARAFSEIIANTQSTGNTFFSIAALTRLGAIYESDNRLHDARETYDHVLRSVGDAILPFACEAHLGLGRIYYEWNDLEQARRHAKASLRISRWMKGSDIPAGCWAFAARLKLADGDAEGAAVLLREAEDLVKRYQYGNRMTEVAAVQVMTFLQQGKLEAAARISFENEIPLERARVHLARDNSAAALSVLEPVRRRAKESAWADLLLKALILQAIALDRAHRASEAVERLEQALLVAEPEELVRAFIDEGPPMSRLLYEAVARGVAPDYASRLLAQCALDGVESPVTAEARDIGSDLIEPLSVREIEVLRCIAEGYSNQDVGSRLFISSHTVKAHTRNIYAKLGAHNRTEAVARARSFGILSDRST